MRTELLVEHEGIGQDDPSDPTQQGKMRSLEATRRGKQQARAENDAPNRNGSRIRRPERQRRERHRSEQDGGRNAI